MTLRFRWYVASQALDPSAGARPSRAGESSAAPALRMTSVVGAGFMAFAEAHPGLARAKRAASEASQSPSPAVWGRDRRAAAGRGALAACLAAFALAAPAAAQNDTTPAGVRLRMTYETTYAPGFVVLPFAGDEGGAARAIVRRDLEFSDRFEMKDPPGGTPAERPDIAGWRERGADWVLQGAVEGGTLRLTLHDAVYGQVKGTGTFPLPARGERGFRMAVHAASDAVVRWATGQPGYAASRIAFVTAGRGSKEIYLVDSDGEGTARVTNDGSIALSPAWAPDGRRLAYTSFKRGGPQLFERDLANGGERTISARDGLNITPAYSPDGRTIAFGATVGGNTELALTTGGGGLRTLTQSRRYENLSPTFSPDGGRIAFVSDRLGEPAVYVMDADGGEPRIVSQYQFGRRGYSTSPDWSPTGPWIAYSTRVAGVAQIAVVGPDGRGARLLTDRGRNEDPSWAPDGRHLVFASPDRDGGGLFVLDTVTGKVRTLVAGRGYGLPAWSPLLARATGE
jgi:TolB protein